MKKRILILMSFFILGLTASYAKSNDDKVPVSVTSEFSRNFSLASNVQWEKIGSYYKVSFNQSEMTLFAFYTEDADFMGIANIMLSDKLPVSLQSQIKKNYEGYWITDLFKFSITDNPGYFIALENADQKIMLKSDSYQNWYLYKTIKK
jgi:hypothetical protein